MSKLKVSELFYSIQGEGRYMGVPSVFLRVFGCNFTCDGFGMPKGVKSDERNIIAQHADQYKDYKSLPLVTTGCDSYASWDVRFKHLSPVVSIDGIVDAILHMLPHGKWTSEHLVITGGEPLLGWQKAYPVLLSHKDMVGLEEITFETNGTQRLTKELKQFIDFEWLKRRKYSSLTFSVSPKLSISGEKWEDAIKPDVVVEYQSLGYTYLKMVVASEEDVEEAEQAVNEYRKHGFKGPVYIMPCGGVESVYSLNNKNVALLAMKKGWRYSDRLQVPLFKNEWGT
ncbi:MAG: 7-carboxy-7-deazaguanine synthase QueE [Caulobacteraceae bacterium]|nr:7-carboxy-7-deazaguanine synthase QueE [Caulobacteraceae bacterium]